MQHVAQGQERSHAGEQHEVVGPGHGVGERDSEVFDLPPQRANALDATVRVIAPMSALLISHIPTLGLSSAEHTTSVRLLWTTRAAGRRQWARSATTHARIVPADVITDVRAVTTSGASLTRADGRLMRVNIRSVAESKHS